MASNTILKNRDIVVVSQQPWDTAIGSTCKNIALEFSKNNRVLYVNNALDRRAWLKEKHDPKVQKRIAVIQGREKGLVAIKEHMWNLYPNCIVESVNWIKIRAVFDALNKRNNRLFAQSIQAAIHELGFKDVILFNDNDIFRPFYLKELLKPAVSVYLFRDVMLGVDYWKFHGKDLEPALIAKSDICVTNTDYIRDYCRQFNPRSNTVGQGCNLEMFSIPEQKIAPDDMQAIKGPIIGYVGALVSLRLDVRILEYIAAQKPEWSIVLVGPEDDVFRNSSLHHTPNVYFLGTKKPEELPGYINSFDVCLNPQIVNETTIGNYPLKIDEYLAMGKPIVATQTEGMKMFAASVYLAANKEEYVPLIEQALKEDNATIAAQRREVAMSHSWTNMVGNIYREIVEFVDSHS
jgi:glycosyltransferase involved in cell wall biosynthesis